MPDESSADHEQRGAGAPRAGDGARPGQGAPGPDECLDAGFLSRDVPPPPGQDQSGSGLGSGEVFDTCLPGPDLAGAADKAAGAARDFADLNDDELIGTLRAFDRMEAWSAAGKAAAAVELARRRPAVGRDRAIRAGKTAPWGTYCADELAAASLPPVTPPSGCWLWPTTFRPGCPRRAAP